MSQQALLDENVLEKTILGRIVQNAFEESQKKYNKQTRMAIGAQEVVKPSLKRMYGVPREEILKEEIFSEFPLEYAFPLSSLAENLRRMKTVFCHSSQNEDDLSKPKPSLVD